MTRKKFWPHTVLLVVVVALAAGETMAAAVETMDFINDTVKVKKTYKDGAEVKFCISKTSKVTNWKGVKLYRKNGAEIVTLKIEGEDNGPFCATVKRSSVEGGFRYEFWRKDALFSESYISGTDVAYFGRTPLARIEYHWVKER